MPTAALSKSRMSLRGGTSKKWGEGFCLKKLLNANKGELFSDQRLRTKITFLQGDPPKEVITGVAEEIARFSQNVPQADDITMMMIRFHGRRDESLDPV